MKREIVNRIAVLAALTAGFATLMLAVSVAPPAALAQAKKKEQLVSLYSFNFPDAYIRHRDALGFITAISSELDRKDASWYLTPGLADPNHVSFRSVNYPNTYLRHQESRIKQHELEDDDLFRKDATFKRINGLAKGGWISFESLNYPDHFIRHKNSELWIEKSDGTELFAKDATFQIAAPFYRP